MKDFFDSLSFFHLRYWQTGPATLVQNIALIGSNMLLFLLCFRTVGDENLRVKLVISLSAICVTYLCGFLSLFRLGKQQSVTEDAAKLARLVLQGWLLSQTLYLGFALQQFHPFAESQTPRCIQAMYFTLPVFLLCLLRTRWNGGLKPQARQEIWGLVIASLALFGLGTILFDWLFLHDEQRQQIIDLTVKYAKFIVA